MSWYRLAADGSALLHLHIQPGAKTSEVVGLHGEALKLRLAAPPVDGKANAALLTFLAEQLGVAKSSLELLRGETSRQKTVKASGVSEEELRRLLA
ncbi:MAG TPA: DUF167 family protein [Rhodocyclaceae bacterium]|nr:DUF167 family protein [Rhodocyclaceae bacterium]